MRVVLEIMNPSIAISQLVVNNCCNITKPPVSCVLAHKSYFRNNFSKVSGKNMQFVTEEKSSIQQIFDPWCYPESGALWEVAANPSHIYPASWLLSPTLSVIVSSCQTSVRSKMLSLLMSKAACQRWIRLKYNTGERSCKTP